LTTNIQISTILHPKDQSREDSHRNFRITDPIFENEIIETTTTINNSPNIITQEINSSNIHDSDFKISNVLRNSTEVISHPLRNLSNHSKSKVEGNKKYFINKRIGNKPGYNNCFGKSLIDSYKSSLNIITNRNLNKNG